MQYIIPVQVYCYHNDTMFSNEYTSCNVVRGNQNNANEILTGASGHELRSIDRMSTNLLSCYLQISERKNRQFGNVVPNSFHFCTRLITKLHWKTSCHLLIWFLVWDKFIPLHLAWDKLNYDITRRGTGLGKQWRPKSDRSFTVEGAVRSGSTLFAIQPASFGHIKYGKARRFQI